MSPVKTQKMGRSFSDQEQATTPTETIEKETIMPKNTFTPDIRNVSDADLAAEIAKRGLEPHTWGDLEPWEPTLPAGFRTVIETDNNGLEFKTAHGPEEWTGEIQVSSHWSKPHGIEFIVCNTRTDDGMTWTRDELEELPGMIKGVLSTLDLSEAKAFFKRFPEPFEGVPTVNDLHRLAGDNNLKTPETFQAYMELTKEAGK